MKILLQGDTHGDVGAVRLALIEAQRAGCSEVIQVGDFGYGWAGPEARNVGAWSLPCLLPDNG